MTLFTSGSYAAYILSERDASRKVVHKVSANIISSFQPTIHGKATTHQVADVDQ